MPRCVTCGTIPGSPMLDAYFCQVCRATWCQTCGVSEVRCPQCAGMQVVAFTLTEDAYL
jgi:hypothetical protein